MAGELIRLQTDERSRDRRHTSARIKPITRWIVFTSIWLAFAGHTVAQVSLYTAVDMALRNSPSVRIATADLEKAAAAVTEAKDAYIPTLSFGSSVGPPSLGFPSGLPSIFNVGSQSLVFSFSQPDYIRAARAGVRASELGLKDARQQVTFDTAMDYLELDKLLRELQTLDEESACVGKLMSIEQERVSEGLDSRTESLKARLTAAQIHLKHLHVENEADSMRQQLAHLTGLPAAGFISCADCIPAAPDLRFDSKSLSTIPASNPGVEAAYATAKSREYLAFGDKRQNLRPQLTFAAQYNRYASFNNYTSYYKNFQPDSFGAGIQIVLPLFDQSKRAKERASLAEEGRAFAVADQARNLSDEQFLRLRGSLAELSAQQDVANLQQQLAQEQFDAVRIQLESSSSTTSAAPLTPKDEQLAHLQERQRFADLLDTRLELMRAQLGLLRLTGEIEDWVKQSPGQ